MEAAGQVEAMEAAGQVEVMEVVLEVVENQAAPGEGQPRLHKVPTLLPLTATPSLRSWETEGTEPLQLEVTGLQTERPAVATPPRAGGGTPGSPTPPPSLRRRRLSQPTDRKCALACQN